MSDRPSVIRSYQRIFRPDRRIYQIDGRRLPIPGGVPLTWLGWAAGTEVAIFAAGERSIVLALLLGLVAAVLSVGDGGWRAACVAGSATAAVMVVLGAMLGVLDWPVRLMVMPVMVATLAGQVTADGRPAHRYALSWLAVRLRPARRSLDRPIPTDGRVTLWRPSVWIAADEHASVLRRARVHGPADVRFAEPIMVAARRVPGGRYVARPAGGGHRAGVVADMVELGEGRVLEIRP